MLFPLAYILGDILTEIYGYKYTWRAIWAAFGIMLMAVAAFTVCATYRQPQNIPLRRRTSGPKVFPEDRRSQLGSVFDQLVPELVYIGKIED